jgi:Ca2+-binding EF-hand superfamily protein
MGCISSRDPSSEDSPFKKTEELLRFGASHSFRHDAVFRKYSSNGQLNSRQFKDAVDILYLSTTNRKHLESVEEFWRLFVVGEHYKLGRLLILGLLLGQGTSKEKAKLLFEIFDEDATHTIDAKGVTSMVQELFVVAVELLPKLTLKAETVTEKHYIENLKVTRASVLEEVTKLILGKVADVTKAKFISVFDTNSVLKNLVTSGGFRTYCYKIYKHNPNPWYMAPKLIPPKVAKSAQSGSEVQGEGGSKAGGQEEVKVELIEDVKAN